MALIENERTPNLTQSHLAPGSSLENKTTSHQFSRPPQPASLSAIVKEVVPEAKLEEPTTMPDSEGTTRLATDDPSLYDKFHSEHFTSSMSN